MAQKLKEAPFYRLEMYVSGDTFVSQRAIESVKALCEEELKDRYALDIVDLQKNPEKAVSDNIVVVPTLVRIEPTPKRKIIGDLQNRERLMRGLEIS